MEMSSIKEKIEDLKCKIELKTCPISDMVLGLIIEDMTKFSIVIKNGKLKLEEGIIKNAEATLVTDSQTLDEIFIKKLSTTKAVISGRIRVKGNISSILKLKEILSQ